MEKVSHTHIERDRALQSLRACLSTLCLRRMHCLHVLRLFILSDHSGGAYPHDHVTGVVFPCFWETEYLITGRLPYTDTILHGAETIVTRPKKTPSRIHPYTRMHTYLGGLQQHPRVLVGRKSLYHPEKQRSTIWHPRNGASLRPPPPSNRRPSWPRAGRPFNLVAHRRRTWWMPLPDGAQLTGGWVKGGRGIVIFCIS